MGFSQYPLRCRFWAELTQNLSSSAGWPMSVNHCIDSISLFCDHEGISGVNTNAEHKRAILALSDRIQNRVWIEKNLISLYLGDLGGFQKLFDMVKSIVSENYAEWSETVAGACSLDELQHSKNSTMSFLASWWRNLDYCWANAWNLSIAQFCGSQIFAQKS
jgi:hypothetical protein